MPSASAVGTQALVLSTVVGTTFAHSNLIYPKPRNAIDSLLPEWSGGKAPYVWEPHGDFPCACTNGTEACESAQTCLWFSDGTSIGCSQPDGGASNPNYRDRCGSGRRSLRLRLDHRHSSSLQCAAAARSTGKELATARQATLLGPRAAS